MIAALFVETGGIYYGLPDVDPWDRDRDARLYNGPHRVIAHPPCNRWCQMARVTQARYGYKVGDDDGCFASALASVRKWGGVLEHPAYSMAWAKFDLPSPFERSGWVRGFCGGWSTHIEQRNYGHRARKGTWLYAYGIDPMALNWMRGRLPEARPRALGRAQPGINRLSESEANRTPVEFRDLLLAMVTR